MPYLAILDPDKLVCNLGIEKQKSIPKDEFGALVGTDRLIAFKDTTLRNFSGSMKLIVVSFLENGKEKYHGYLTNDYESTEEQILNEKSWRWRIENFFKEYDFVGLDALPSIELNKIAAMMDSDKAVCIQSVGMFEKRYTGGVRGSYCGISF